MKKYLLIASAVFVILFGALQIFIWQIKPTDQEVLRDRAAVLPDLSLTTLDGQPFHLVSGKPVVLVYFNSNCDHCQRQIAAMVEDQHLFDGIMLVFMSAQPFEELIGVGIPVSESVQLVRCKHEEIGERFGVLGLPQIFIYDKDGGLSGLFAGETPVKEILIMLELAESTGR